MKSFTVTTALLLGCFCWSTKSYIVKVKLGEDVNLSCRNIANKPVPTFWAKLLHDSNYCHIASINGSFKDQMSCEGIPDKRFIMSSTKSQVTLQIRRVEMADCGFYFCGLDVFGKGDICVYDLKVKGNDSWCDGDMDSKCESNPTWWMSILGGACVLLLTIIVGFPVKIKRLQTEQNREENAPRENLASENLNYVAVYFKQKPRRAASTESSVIYAATK